MVKVKQAEERQNIGKDIQNVMDLPDLIDIQLNSYERFLQRGKVKKGERLNAVGLQEVFDTTFPIKSPNDDMRLEFEYYTFDEENIKVKELECKQKGLTYSVPLKARINLAFTQTGEIRQKDIYMGDIPLMTERGTFIINGAERVVVSQIHRSPGVIFSHDKDVYSSRIIPYRGSWLEFEIDKKRELIYAKIDRKKRILGTIFLRTLGFSTREDIISAFYTSDTLKIKDDRETKEKISGKILAKQITIQEPAIDEVGNITDKTKEKVLFRAGDKLHPHNVDELVQHDIKSICFIDFQAEGSLNSTMILNCFEREDIKFVREAGSEPSKEESLMAVYSVLMPGESITVEQAEKDLIGMFFSDRRYDLGKVGRYKLNKKFNLDLPNNKFTLANDDIKATMKHLIKVFVGDEAIDDIDHLGNRRIRSVGELMANQMKTAFSR
ncbi:MAG: DNA-directed RNA polymerase subunit beta, partial [Treponema sp.]|nr:DNA-directed RNA polymerase subunit beta [Treponema sp.]